jgi:DNA repair protein RadC
MELRVFDHIIIGENQYYSFADSGLIEEYEMQAVKMM